MAYYWICVLLGISLTVSEPTVILNDGIEVIGKSTTSINNVVVWEFLGIPYAQPPVGHLRFLSPQPLIAKSSIIYATEYSPICMQNVNGSYLEKWMIEEEIPLSEDCLYLNVWVPKKSDEQQSALPVMVWIHGGGYYAGSSREPVAKGTTLAARENVIIVSMNYRLSIFGFAYAGIPEAPGNMGLLDQLEALKWVKDNIATFGGDPSAVTLFGVSAGGTSVSLHGLSRLSRPYFKRIICQSGVAADPWATRDGSSMKRSLSDIATAVGCYSSRDGVPDFTAIVTCMKMNTPEELLVTFQPLIDEEVMSTTFAPVVDGYFLYDDPISILNSRRLPPVDMIVGTVANEGGEFLYEYFPEYFNLSDMSTVNISAENYKTMLEASIPKNLREDSAVIKAAFYEYKDPGDSFLRASVLANLIADVHFDSKTEFMAQCYAEFNAKIYRYVFNYPDPGAKLPWLKCPHSAEKPFVFGYPLLDPRSEKKQVQMSKYIIRFWANFARTGNPNLNPDGTMTFVKWPNYGDKAGFIMLDDVLITSSFAYKRRQTNFWNNFLPDMINLTDLCPSDYNREVCRIRVAPSHWKIVKMTHLTASSIYSMGWIRK